MATLYGTVTAAAEPEAAPDRVTVNCADWPSSTVAAWPAARAMAAVMGSEAGIMVAAAAPYTVPPSASASATLTCTVKFSAPSFRVSPAMVRVKVLAVLWRSAGPKLSVPLRSAAAAKSASTVPPLSACATVQVTTVAEVKAAPVRVTL